MTELLWSSIKEFPGYSINNRGFVRNDETDRVLANCVNTRGIVYVGMSKGAVQYKREIALLVATAFVKRERRTFDTPIHLDGDRANNNAWNIVWRPRWFAIKYFQQFQQEGPSIGHHIREMKTRKIYRSSWEAATELGLLDREIAIAIMNKTYVFPSFKRFEIVK